MAVLIRHAWEGMLRSEIETSLRQKTLMFASRVAEAPPSSLRQITKQAAAAADARVTVIDSAGKVLADSEADPDEMENHATRPEFVAALHGQVGSSTRLSHTIGVELLYVAAPIPGGAVRLAYPLSAIREANRRIGRDLLEAAAGRGFDRHAAGVRCDAVHRPQAGPDHRLCRACRGRRPFGAHSGGVDRRNRARRLGARQDGAQAGGRIPRPGEQPPDAGNSAELHAGSGDRGGAGRARAVGQPAHGTSAAQRSAPGRAAGAIGARSRNPDGGAVRAGQA